MTGVALVTGATSGIGREFARRLAGSGTDLVAVGRRRERLDELIAEFPDVRVRGVVADLATPEGANAVARIAADEPLTMLVNNAGVAYYGPFVELTAQHAVELVNVKVLAPVMVARAAAPGMVQRGGGSIVNVAGMIAFSSPATLEQVGLRRAVYAASLAHSVAFSQTLQAELSPHGVQVQSLNPGVVRTEFHERQGIDLSGTPRMSAADVVTASLRGLELGEVITAPGVADPGLFDTVFAADLAAFGGQSPDLAERYR